MFIELVKNDLAFGHQSIIRIQKFSRMVCCLISHFGFVEKRDTEDIEKTLLGKDFGILSEWVFFAVKLSKISEFFLIVELTKEKTTVGRNKGDIRVADLDILCDDKLDEISSIHFTLFKAITNDLLCPVILEVILIAFFWLNFA